MPAAPDQAVYGAAVRPITGGPPVTCNQDQCPGDATWVVLEEHGDEDYVYYSCDEDLADLARAAIEDGKED